MFVVVAILGSNRNNPRDVPAGNHVEIFRYFSSDDPIGHFGINIVQYSWLPRCPWIGVF